MPKCLFQILIIFFKYRLFVIFLLSFINCVKQTSKKNDLIVFYVKENSPIGEIVGQIQTPGFLPPYEVHYLQDIKKITISKTGIIKVAGPIDREKETLYSTLIISMTGETKTIEISVLDMNDNIPKFNVTHLEKSIPENYPIGSKVDLTTVYDPDIGLNSIQNVKIISGDSEKNFAIDYHDGSNGLFYLRLILKQPLDYESISQFNLVIQAIDGGIPPLQSTLIVKIHILNANDNVPKFDISRYIATIKENQEINKTILRVRATDNDVGVSGELFYFLDSNSVDNQLFVVNSKTGDLSLQKKLDFEQTKSHQINVGVKDNFPPFHSSKVPVIIDVIDINDNPPEIHVIWTYGVAQILRDIEPNSIVAHIKVTDADVISTSFELKIMNQTPFLLIKILPKMWELRTINDINDIKSNNISLTLLASDYPEPSLSTTTTISIKLKQTTLNDISFQNKFYSTEINGPIIHKNQHIITLDIIKTTMKSNFYFILLNYQKLFQINQTTGEITSNNFIDCGIYPINISLISLKNQLTIDNTILQVTITSDRRLPLYFEKGYRKIVVMLGKPQCFYQIAVGNRHCGMKVVYSLESVLSEDGLLGIDRYGAICVTDNFINYKLSSQVYLYKIKAQDENNSSVSSITLFVIQPSGILETITPQINITLPLLDSINYSIPIAKVLGIFSQLTSNNFLGLIQYQIISQDYPSELLFVDHQSGEITMKKYPLDKSEIKVIIKGSGIDKTSLSTIFTLKVDFKNIYFTKSIYQFILDNNHIKLTSVIFGQVSVVLQPSNKQSITYHLIYSRNNNTDISLDSTTGIISGRNVYLIPQKVINLSIYATSNDGQICYAQILIFLEYNLNIPAFHYKTLTVNIWENMTVGSEIVQVIPKFISESDRYSIIPSLHSSSVSISRKTGSIILVNQFDREKTKFAQITVMLSNQIGTTTLEINLEILDINDNYPQCKDSSFDLTIQDRSVYGTQICPLKCYDPDSLINANLTYCLKKISPLDINNPFQIQRTTGCLISISSLDIWDKNPDGIFHLTITVSDNGPYKKMETDIQIRINILDTNNHKPSLVSYNIFYVLQSSLNGVEIGSLLFEDADRGFNGDINVSIKQLKYSQCFYLQKINKNQFLMRPNSGLLCNLDIGIHNIILILSDNGSPIRSSNTNIILNIDSANNFDPQIIYPRQNEPIIFRCPLPMGSELFTVKSDDGDKELNWRPKYALQVLNENEDLINIDMWSGLVTNRYILPCSYELQFRISVFDMGYPNRSHYIDTFLKPLSNENLDDNSLKHNFTIILSNNLQPGLIVSELNLFPEYLGTKYLFSNNSSSSFDQFLHISYDSSKLLLLKDDKTISRKSYTIIATFHKSSPIPNSISFIINLIVNRIYIPWLIFSKHSQRIIYVKENQPAGTFVGKFSLKKFEYLAVRFSIRQPGNYFVINPQSGSLVTFRPFDRESELQDHFMIIIVATNIGDPSRSAILPVRVEILDENDNFPLIVSPSNTVIKLLFAGSLNKQIIRIISKDRDVGNNAQIIYGISNPTKNIFAINETTGEMSLLSVPKDIVYKVNVTVTDLGDIPNLSWMVYSFQFTNRQDITQPRLLSHSLSINLTLPQTKRNFFLGKITHSQKSLENLDFRYHLEAGKFSQIFAIHPVSGDIRTLQPIAIDDMGNCEIIQLSVILQSNKNPLIYDVGNLFIYIDYGNLNTPKFSKTNFKIKLPEDEAITDFLTVAANDPDLGIFGKIKYKLSGDTFDKKIFIDPSTGRLSCSPLSYTEKKVYNLQVTATDCEGDSIGLRSFAKIKIFVQNTKRDPLEFNSTHFSLKVMENAPAGTLLGRINVIRPPSNTEVIYILNPSNSFIHINSTSGELKTNGPLHRKRIQFMDLKIQAFAKSFYTRNIQRTSAIIDIQIIDINDNFPIPSTNPLQILIPDTNLLPTPLGKLSASDADEKSIITYQFDLKDPITFSLSNLYDLDKFNGNIFLKSPVSKKEIRRHILSVIVSDNGSPHRSIIVILDISLNHDPNFLQIKPEKAIFKVMENSVPGTFIGQLELVGTCTTGSPMFSVIDGVNKELVSLHEESGKIFVAISGNIDREMVEVIILWTKVVCQKSPRIGYKKVIIHVEDMDDNKPVFAQDNYVAFLNEGQPPKTSVIRTTIYDPDILINSQVEYFIELYSSQEEFFIDSNGEVKTNIPLNFHTKANYNLVIKATAKASPLIFAECRLTVYIININDQRPIISRHTQQIHLDTNSPVGSLIAKISAKDSDGPDGISYRIRHRLLANESLFISIGYDSGEIYLSRKLLVSDVGKHELDVVADDGKYSDSTVINVDINDDNNHMPTLRENMKIISITDSTKPGSIFVYLHAEDKDEGQNGRVEFELITPSNLFGLRTFSNNTAAMHLLNVPVQENRPYFLGIQLTDGSSNLRKRLTSMSTIIIKYESKNPNPPIFLRNTSSFITISESFAIGNKVTQFTCRDSSFNQSVIYRIKQSEDPGNFFHVDMDSGELLLISSLKFTTKPRIMMEILCEVRETPQRMAKFNFTVNIQQENKSTIFPPNTILNVSLQVSDIAKPPALIYKLENFERNSLLFTYQLLSVVPQDPENIEESPNFKLDHMKNIWLMDGDLLQCESWMLIIQVEYERFRSRNTHFLYNSGYLYINLSIKDPIFSNLKNCVDIKRLTGVVLENEPPLTKSLSLPNWYPNIRYTMASNQYFILNCETTKTKTCIIKTKTILDFESREQYRLQLVVTGSYGYLKSCSHILMVEISVLDVDEYSPEFTKSSYNYEVEGGIPSIGQHLLTVYATDKDRGRFGIVTYHFADKEYENFEIKNDSGIIILKTAFAGSPDFKKRIKRSSEEIPKPKNYKKTFQFRILASSGIKTSYAYVELTMLVPWDNQLVPGSRLSEVNIILMATVPTFAIILVVIIVLIILMRRKYKCIKTSHSSFRSPTDSPKTSNSWNLQNNPSYKQRYLPRCPNSIGLPDVTQLTTPLNYNLDNLPNSDTQDFSLSYDETKQLSNSSQGTNDNQNAFYHLSETSIKLDEQIPNHYAQEFSNNNNNNNLCYNQLNCDSGIGHGHGHRVCDFYDDSGMENKRISKTIFEQSPKYQNSNVSLTSSSGYSAISHSQPHNIPKMPPNKLLPQNPASINNNSISLLRDGQINISNHARNRPQLGTNRLMQSVSSSALKNNSDLTDLMQMQQMTQFYPCKYLDIKNNNHHSTLPMLPHYLEDGTYLSEQTPYYHSNYHPNVTIQSPRSTNSAISSNSTVPDTYADITEL